MSPTERYYLCISIARSVRAKYRSFGIPVHELANVGWIASVEKQDVPSITTTAALYMRDFICRRCSVQTDVRQIPTGDPPDHTLIMDLYDCISKLRAEDRVVLEDYYWQNKDLTHQLKPFWRVAYVRDRAISKLRQLMGVENGLNAGKKDK